MLAHGNFNYSMLNNQATRTHPATSYHHDQQIDKVKRHYNSEVDPARYRKVSEEGVTKFACSLCGNTYKWRKSLNKHWKEKHITEQPPPLDAPVTVKLRNGNTTINCIATSNSTQHISHHHSPKANSENLNTSNKAPLYQKQQKSQKNPTPQLANSQPQLPFSPSLLVAAAAAANAATSGSNQMPNGQLHPAYWTVFHQYLNTATTKSSTESSTNKFSINSLTAVSPKHHPTKQESSSLTNHSEAPLDLSMKQPIVSRRSSVNSAYSHQSQASQKQRERHSRRSGFNIQQMMTRGSRSSSRCSSASRSIDSSMSNTNKDLDTAGHGDLKQDQYQSYMEDEALNMTQGSMSKHSQSSAAMAAAAAATAYNQKLFVCSICDAKFHVVDHINEHFLKNHYNEYQRELSSKSPPRNTNVAQQNEEWNLSDPNNPLKCIKCDFVGRWPTELQKHAASHSTSRPFKCLICSLTYKWRWDLAKHFDRTHPNFRNPYKKRDRDAARSNLVTPGGGNNNSGNMSLDQDGMEEQYQDDSRSRSRSSSSGSERRAAEANMTRMQQMKCETPMKLQKQKSLVDLAKSSSSAKTQVPSGLNQVQNDQASQFANNPMMAYFAALQTNMLQQQQPPNGLNLTNTPSSSTSSSASSSNNSNQISPFSLLQQQQQQQQKNVFLPQQAAPGFNPMDNSNSTTAILAAAMAAIAQGNVDPNNMSQLLPHLLQNMQQQQSQSSSSSTTSSTISTNNHLHHQRQHQPVEQNFNSNLLSPSSSSSSHSYKQHTSTNNTNKQPLAKKQKLTDSLMKSELDVTTEAGQQNGEKEARNFLCYWCDFRGRWRSEIIQHMRCHHAREKPYRCSACMYASNWKWDVQKHTKKQHPNNQNAKIVEISDQILFPDLKEMNFFENVKPTLPNSTPDNIKKIPSALNLTPPNSSSASSTSSSSSSSSVTSKPIKTHENRGRPKSKPTYQHQQQPASFNQRSVQETTTKSSSKHHSLCCQQCPYVACNLSDLRRHLIVHSNEQPYHCCSCDFKSKWKADVKKHQRNVNHIGPILVGKKAMQKVIENLGLDKNSMVTLYGPNIQVIDNKQCKSNEKLIDEDSMSFKSDQVAFQKNKSKFIQRPKSIEESLKRKRDESDCEEYEEQQYDDEDYEQLNECEDIEDEYEQVLAYNNQGNYGDLEDEEQLEVDDEGMQMAEEDGEMVLNEYDSREEEVGSQFTDDNNCNDELVEHNLNEFEEGIDC